VPRNPCSIRFIRCAFAAALRMVVYRSHVTADQEKICCVRRRGRPAGVAGCEAAAAAYSPAESPPPSMVARRPLQRGIALRTVAIPRLIPVMPSRWVRFPTGSFRSNQWVGVATGPPVCPHRPVPPASYARPSCNLSTLARRGVEDIYRCRRAENLVSLRIKLYVPDSSAFRVRLIHPRRLSRQGNFGVAADHALSPALAPFFGFGSGSFRHFLVALFQAERRKRSYPENLSFKLKPIGGLRARERSPAGVPSIGAFWLQVPWWLFSRSSMCCVQHVTH